MQLVFQTRDNGDLCSTWLGHLEIYDIYECIYIIHNICTIYNIIYIYKIIYKYGWKSWITAVLAAVAL